jgi:hypothetical protein
MHTNVYTYARYPALAYNCSRMIVDALVTLPLFRGLLTSPKSKDIQPTYESSISVTHVNMLVRMFKSESHGTLAAQSDDVSRQTLWD